jgi:hypothetical protein
VEFEEWLVQEHNLKELYASTVSAFPRTTKRQHATDPIKVNHLEWVPFLGLGTLFVKAIVESNGKEYNPIIVFKNVSYDQGDKLVELTANDGKNYILNQLSSDKNNVLVRCACEDFAWRFNYWDHINHDLYGKKRKKYEAQHAPGTANPAEQPGMCKHLIKMIRALQESGILL